MRQRVGKLKRASASSGFDFTQHVRLICADMAVRLPQLGHVDMSRVAIRFCQARRAVPHGLQAALTPLRFEHGELVCRRRGKDWTIQRLYDSNGREMLYLLSFYLPRFLEHGLREKLSTILHELWHIGPMFDGDLRRHAGRCYAHSHSQQRYNDEMDQLADRWLSLEPAEELYSFLRLTFRQLQHQHGPVYGLKLPTPKLLPFDSAAATAPPSLAGA